MEFLDVVDENDQVVGKASKHTVYKKLLPHRIIHIFIFNKKGQMALQLRSKNVSFCPNHWSSAVGGYVRSGENYEEAALRECIEELGIRTQLIYLSKEIYRLENGLIKILVIFKALFDGPFDIDHKEVEKVEFLSLRKIKKMMKMGEKFHPELKFLLEKHRSYFPF